MHNITPIPKQSASRKLRGMTLIEVLCSVVITALLASLVLGSVQKVNSWAKRTKCLGNLKQLHAASMQFVQDNNGILPQTYHDWETAIVENPDDGTISGGGIASYLYPERVALPAAQRKDYRGTVFQDPDARNASVKYPLYSGGFFEAYLGGKTGGKIDEQSVHYARNNDVSVGGHPRRMSELAKPSRFYLYVCSSVWNLSSDAFMGLSTTYERIAPRHNGRFNMIFADGHAVTYDEKIGSPEFSDFRDWRQ